ncbi:MAG TPA: HAD family hydrolase [Candidatus Polarisedimenticolia bacterium]|nr:HAD family hydrolase [Candidatus Polarisedimenticolia bacterium]
MTKIAAPSASRRAVFLDRDGTVADEVGYVNHASRLRLLPRSAEAVRKIRETGFLAVVVTNQAGVARDYFEEFVVGETHERLKALLAEQGASLDGIYYCPHHPKEGIAPYRQDCQCRKPRPGMLVQAARDLGIDLARSYMVGDGIVDVGAARAAGVVPVLVLTGYGRGHFEHRRSRWSAQPEHIAEDLFDAVEWILERERRAS